LGGASRYPHCFQRVRGGGKGYEGKEGGEEVARPTDLFAKAKPSALFFFQINIRKLKRKSCDF